MKDGESAVRMTKLGISLADALRQVDLQVGHVYQCRVGQFRVEVRVDEAVPPVLPTPLYASDVMLDASGSRVFPWGIENECN